MIIHSLKNDFRVYLQDIWELDIPEKWNIFFYQGDILEDLDTWTEESQSANQLAKLETPTGFTILRVNMTEDYEAEKLEWVSTTPPKITATATGTCSWCVLQNIEVPERVLAGPVVGSIGGFGIVGVDDIDFSVDSDYYFTNFGIRFN